MGGIIDNDTLLAKLLIKEVKKDKDLKLVEPQGTALHGAIALGEQMIADMED